MATGAIAELRFVHVRVVLLLSLRLCSSCAFSCSYCGHNAGEQFLSPDTVQTYRRCPVALLIGCSSGRLAEQGDFEPYGPILAYLQGGSAAALGNLWHVTDADIDRFTLALLDAWLSDDGKSLPEVIASARRACKFPYLVGAAPVCYGVPVYISGSPALETLQERASQQ